MMHVLARERLVDREFLRQNALGFEDLEAEILPAYPPERAASLTGLAADTVVDLAERFGAARAPFIRLGSGLSRYANGAMTVRTIVCLPALTGAWARPGGGCLGSTSSSQAFDLRGLTREDLLPRPTRVVNMNRLGHALTELDPPVMSLYVYASNPAAVAPDQNAVMRGLARPDLFTVVHERFLTDTARWADVVLPATTSLEHHDLYRAYGHYCLQQVAPAIPPQGQAKPNWEVFQLLAAAMGFDDPIFRAQAPDLIDRLLATPSPLRQGIDRAALSAGRAVELNLPEDARTRWVTPTGKIEILNPRLKEKLPTWTPSYEDQGTLPFRLMTGPSTYSLNSTFMERQDLVRKQKGMRLKMNPGDASARGLRDGGRVVAFNGLGEATFVLEVTGRTPPGVVVAEGVFWLDHAPGRRNVNVLTSQRLTDDAGGSTFYDNRVDVRAEG
jgi:anaerobic selenocysteine-containing dehydrogenase